MERTQVEQGAKDVYRQLLRYFFVKILGVNNLAGLNFLNDVKLYNMQQFLSKILKNKKIILLCFSVLILTAITIPTLALRVAGPTPELADFTTNNPTDSNNIYNSASGATTVFGTFVNGIVSGIFLIPLTIITTLSTISKELLTGIIEIATTKSYTHSEAVNIGWPIVRDLANMLIVLGFVVIGIATALRIKEYEAKQLLTKLIVAALLVNFSLLICGVLVDATNILMKYFFNGSVGDIVSEVSNPFALFSAIHELQPVDFAAKIVGLMIFHFIAAFIYILYAILIIGRVVALWALVILSPLAFVCRVFPATKKVWDDWSKNFLQWCIIIIPGGLFYFIGQTILSKALPNPAQAGDYISDAISIMLVPSVFLIIGFLVSLQTSAMGAGAITGFAKKHGGKIASGGLSALNKAHSKTTGALLGWGGGKISQLGDSLAGRGNKIGGGVLKATGGGIARFKDFRASAQQTKAGIMRGLEFTGAVGAGAAGAMEAKTLKENQSRMSALISQGRLAEVNSIAEGRGAGSNPAERAAAVGALLKSKNFDTNNQNHKDGLTHFVKHGGDIGEYAEKDPQLAEYDEPAIRNTLAKENTADKIKIRGHKITWNDAKEMVKNDAYAGMSVKDLRESSTGAVNINLLASMKTEKLKKASEEFSSKKIDACKKYADVARTGYAGSIEWQTADAQINKLLATGKQEDTDKANRIRANIALIGTHQNFQ